MAKSEVYNVNMTFGSEDSYGTLNSSANGYNITVVSSSLTVSQNITDSNEFDGNYVNPDKIKGNFSVSGSIVMRVRPQSVGYFLTWFLGAPTTTGASAPYTHTFTANSSTVKTFQAEVSRSDVDSGSEYELFKGLLITGIDTSVDGDGQMNLTVNVVGGKKPTYSATSAFTGTVTDMTTETDVFNSIDGTLSAGTTFTGINASYSMTRNSELVNGIGDAGEASDYYRAKYGAEGSVTFIFENKDVMSKALADTSDNLSIGASKTFTNANSITFNNPTIKWRSANQTPDAGSTQQLATMSFDAYGSLNVVLINDAISYASV